MLKRNSNFIQVTGGLIGYYAGKVVVYTTTSKDVRGVMHAA